MGVCATVGTVERMRTRVDLPVEGMTCAACSARIAQGLDKLDGVETANVSLASARATIVYDDDGASTPTTSAAVIAELGYSVPEVDDHAAAEAAWIRTLGRRLVLAAVAHHPDLPHLDDPGRSSSAAGSGWPSPSPPRSCWSAASGSTAPR